MSDYRPTEQERSTYRWLFASSSFGSSMLAGGLHGKCIKFYKSKYPKLISVIAIQIFMFIYGVSVLETENSHAHRLNEITLRRKELMNTTM